jgi:hypothetical protein
MVALIGVIIVVFLIGFDANSVKSVIRVTV